MDNTQEPEQGPKLVKSESQESPKVPKRLVTSPLGSVSLTHGQAKQRTEAIGALAGAFPRQDMPADTIMTYVVLTADIPFDELRMALITAMKRLTFLPSIGEIRRIIVEKRAGLPSFAEAVNSIATMKKTDHPNGVTSYAMSDLNPLVAQVFRDVGGPDALEKDKFFHKNFGEQYKGIREQMINELMEGTG